MRYISALCMVLALSFIAASADSEAKVEQLEDKIASAVAERLVIVAKDEAAANLNNQELIKKLVAAANTTFEQLKPQVKELMQLSNSSPEVIAKDLTHRINQNQALKNALPKGGELSPRFSGVVGTIGNIVYDIAKAIDMIIEPTK